MLLSGHRLSSLGIEGYADFENPIVAALYYGVFGVYGFHQLLTRRYTLLLTVFFSVCVLTLSAYVYCTLSRGVWLGYAAAIGASVVLHHNARSRKWLALAAVAVALVALWLAPVLLEQKARGFTLRDLIWADWLQRLPDFWLFGAGAGQKFDTCIENVQCFTQAHNLYLQFFFEFGIIGMLLLLLVTVQVVTRSLKREYWSYPLATLGFPLIVFALVTAMFDYHTVMNRPGVYWLVFWMPVGLILSIGPRLVGKYTEEHKG
jgi:O-antigen ligase